MEEIQIVSLWRLPNYVHKHFILFLFNISGYRECLVLIIQLHLLLGKFTEPWDFGYPEEICSRCGAILWYEEMMDKSKNPSFPKFNICC